MAVTTTYEYDFIADVATNLPGSANGAQMVGLANGGFAYVVTRGTNSFFEAYNANGVATASGLLTGVTPSLTQLNNGSLVVTTTDSAGVHFAAYDPSDGSVLVLPTSIPEDNTSAPDVAALTNGGLSSSRRTIFPPPTTISMSSSAMPTARLSPPSPSTIRTRMIATRASPRSPTTASS